MARRFVVRPLATADITTPPTYSQRFKFDANFELSYIRAMLILYNDPVFTSVSMRIFGERGTSAGKLIATSDSRTKAELLTTQDHAYKSTWFEFDDPVAIRAGVNYHAAIDIAGYTGTSSTFIGLASSWPDPVYQTGVTMLQTKAAKMPLDIQFFGRTL